MQLGGCLHGTVIYQGTIIETYPDDTPFPSCLALHFMNGLPIHVVYSIDESTDTVYIITAYRPDSAVWQESFTKRK
jgi:hypothetical protein